MPFSKLKIYVIVYSGVSQTGIGNCTLIEKRIGGTYSTCADMFILNEIYHPPKLQGYALHISI